MKNKTMVDINRWFECKYDNPDKKGKYLLMIGLVNRMAGHTNTGIIEAYWDGKTWVVSNRNYVFFKWKYIRPGEIDKYPNFEKNNRHIDL